MPVNIENVVIPAVSIVAASLRRNPFISLLLIELLFYIFMFLKNAHLQHDGFLK